MDQEKRALNKRAIVERASTIDERLRGNVFYDGVSQDENQIATRLEQWQKNVAKGDSAVFEKRLAWDNWMLRPYDACMAT
jgi:hypothetical protein